MSTDDVVPSAKNLSLEGTYGNRYYLLIIRLAIFSLLKFNATMQYASLSFSLNPLHISERPNEHV